MTLAADGLTIYRGEVNPLTNVVCRRIPCPVVPTRWAFEHLLDKDEVAWQADKKNRSLLGGLGVTAVPFATEAWAVLGVYIPPEMLLGSHAGGYYWHFGQMQEGTNDLLNAGSISCNFAGGNGDASKARLEFDVKRYYGTGWPGAPVEESGNPIYESVLVAAPAPNVYHYLIFNYLVEPGYSDPTYGAIYGGVEGVDQPKGFVRVYYAKGESDTSPVLIAEYRGWWGSPWVPGQVTATELGYIDGKLRHMRAPQWHSGIYSKHTFQPAGFGTVQRIINRGWQVHIARNNPGMTAATALYRYRQP